MQSLNSGARRRHSIAVIAVASAVLGACGGDEGGSSPPAADAAVQGSAPDALDTPQALGADRLRCEPPLTVCGDACVDTRTDARHCGSCDVSCASELGCLGGACAGPCEGPAGCEGELTASQAVGTGDCCSAHEGPGCGVPEIETCVCAVDALCCQGGWDDACVETVGARGCGQCDLGSLDGEVGCVLADQSDALPATLRGTLEGALDNLETACGSLAEPDAVFEYTAPQTGTYTFETSSADVADTVLAVFAAPDAQDALCGGGELACNDDDGLALSSRLSLELQAGQRVRVLVESWDGELGEVEVGISFGVHAAPQAVSCSASELVGSLPIAASGTVSGDAGSLTPSCALYGSAGEVLYSFTASQSGTYRFDTRGSDADTLIQILDGDCMGAELACNDDSELGGLAALVDVPLEAGQTVLVNVDSLDGVGEYRLSVELGGELGGDTETGSADDCCTPSSIGGCQDAEIAACVCADDDYCCTVEWDALCVQSVSFLACGGC